MREFQVHAGVVMTIVKDGYKAVVFGVLAARSLDTMRRTTLFTGGQDQAVFAMDVREGKPFALYRCVEKTLH